MSSKVTELDRTIARNIREFRTLCKLTQPQVADYLGMTYQSYQKLEGARVSFRASTLDKLGQLYNKRLQEIVRGSETELDPLIVKASRILHGMGGDAREAAIRAILRIKQGEFE
jgi:transcriptional regulator with XRE-family HTH domain